MSKKKVVLPILIIVVALVLSLLLLKSRQAPQPHEQTHLGPLV